MPVPEILQNRGLLLSVIALITTISALGPFFLEEFNPVLVAHVTLHIAAITFGAVSYTHLTLPTKRIV